MLFWQFLRRAWVWFRGSKACISVGEGFYERRERLLWGITTRRSLPEVQAHVGRQRALGYDGHDGRAVGQPGRRKLDWENLSEWERAHNRLRNKIDRMAIYGPNQKETS